MTRAGRKRVQKASFTNAGTAAAFKYYIHDTAEGYCIEISGPFMESSIFELSCCWQTAKPTLKNRALKLDLRGITAIDQSAWQWLEDMNEEGASYLPNTFMPESLQPNREISQATKIGIFGRLRMLFAGSLKPAQ